MLGYIFLMIIAVFAILMDSAKISESYRESKTKEICDSSQEEIFLKSEDKFINLPTIQNVEASSSHICTETNCPNCGAVLPKERNIDGSVTCLYCESTIFN